MILSNEEAEKRLRSPLNLINSMKNNNGSRKNGMSLFIKPNEEVKEKENKVILFNPFENKELKDEKERSEVTEVTSIEKSSPTVNDLIDNHDNQIKLSLAHDSALDVLSSSLAELKAKLSELHPSKLPSVIAATSKVVESIRKERNEAAKNGKDREVHYHFYTPERKSVSDYEVIDVTP